MSKKKDKKKKQKETPYLVDPLTEQRDELSDPNLKSFLLVHLGTSAEHDTILEYLFTHPALKAELGEHTGWDGSEEVTKEINELVLEWSRDCKLGDTLEVGTSLLLICLPQSGDTYKITKTTKEFHQIVVA